MYLNKQWGDVSVSAYKGEFWVIGMTRPLTPFEDTA